MGQRTLEPQRWTCLNHTHQRVQGALAGQGVALVLVLLLALVRLALLHEPLLRGALVEPFGPAGRLAAPAAYWLLPLPGVRLRPELRAELRAFADGVRGEAAVRRAAPGRSAPATAGPATRAGCASTP